MELSLEKSTSDHAKVSSNVCCLQSHCTDAAVTSSEKIDIDLYMDNMYMIIYVFDQQIISDGYQLVNLYITLEITIFQSENSHGFPRVFLWFSYDFLRFPMVLLRFPMFSYSFPMVFPWFSYDFPRFPDISMVDGLKPRYLKFKNRTTVGADACPYPNFGSNHPLV